MQGTILLADGTPICAMVLANGQYMFSCDGEGGAYDLGVPLDANGQITFFSFADGLFAKRYRNLGTVCGIDVKACPVMAVGHKQRIRENLQ